MLRLTSSMGLICSSPCSIELSERLPPHIAGPCALTCNFELEKKPDYYLLQLTAKGMLTIHCQRCLASFTYPYENHTELALCDSEEVAERLLSNYEPVIYRQNEVNLEQILTDELFLYSIHSHPEMNDCESEMTKYIRFSE